MAIRVNCTIPGHEDNWIEFRGEGWTLGDRIRFGKSRDLTAMELILQWAVDWHLTDSQGNEIEKGETINCFERVPMSLWPWLLAAVYQAFDRAAVLSKN